MDSIGVLRSDLNPSSCLPSAVYRLPLMTRPDYWLTKFSKLRIDRARGDPAAHKPLASSRLQRPKCLRRSAVSVGFSAAGSSEGKTTERCRQVQAGRREPLGLAAQHRTVSFHSIPPPEDICSCIAFMGSISTPTSIASPTKKAICFTNRS